MKLTMKQNTNYSLQVATSLGSRFYCELLFGRSESLRFFLSICDKELKLTIESLTPTSQL